MGQVTNATGKRLSNIFTKRPKNDQQLQDISGGNNVGRYLHRGWDQGLSSKY